MNRILEFFYRILGSSTNHRIVSSRIIDESEILVETLQQRGEKNFRILNEWNLSIWMGKTIDSNFRMKLVCAKCADYKLAGFYFGECTKQLDPIEHKAITMIRDRRRRGEGNHVPGKVVIESPGRNYTASLISRPCCSYLLNKKPFASGIQDGTKLKTFKIPSFFSLFCILFYKCRKMYGQRRDFFLIDDNSLLYFIIEVLHD